MTKEELAAKLNGREYGKEITKEEEAAAKAAGLVVVFGYSDDNVELRGAIDDEIGAYDGTTVRVCPEGLLPNWPADSDEGWSEREAEDYFRRKALGFRDIEAVWNSEQGEPAWTYRTDIPHATFDVMEDGALYCRGIVFSLSDIQPTDPDAGATVTSIEFREKDGRLQICATVPDEIKETVPGALALGALDYVNKVMSQVTGQQQAVQQVTEH